MSTGAADDLRKATDIARSIVTRFGMDEALGNVSYEEEGYPLSGAMPTFAHAAPHHSEDTTPKIDVAIRMIIQQAFERATAVLKEKERCPRKLRKASAGTGDAR